MLIFATSFLQTVLQPELLGLDRPQLPTTHQPPPSGAGLINGVISKEITLEIASHKWRKRSVAVVDLSQVLSAYQERIDGILGLDFLRDFDQVTINLKGKTLIFIGEANGLPLDSSLTAAPSPKLSFGTQRKFALAGSEGHYTLNGVALPNVLSEYVYLSTSDGAYKVRVRFLKTIQVSRGEPVSADNRALLEIWAQSVPLVAKVLKDRDEIASMKLLFYDLIEPAQAKTLAIQEELTYLWSSDPEDSGVIGEPIALPPVSFPGHVVDLQYRGSQKAAKRLFGKIALQILYIGDQSSHFLLGGFLIVSTPNGEYEFYLVPRDLLERIITD